MQLDVNAITDKVVTFLTGPQSIALTDPNPQHVLDTFKCLQYPLSKVLGAVIGDACRNSLKDLAAAIRSNAKLKEAKPVATKPDATKTAPQPTPEPVSQNLTKDTVSKETEKSVPKKGGKIQFKVIQETKETKPEPEQKVSSTTHKRIEVPEAPKRAPDGSQQTDYENELLGSVVEYCYRTFNNLGLDKSDLPDYYPRKTSVLGSYASLSVPDCWYDFGEDAKSWKSDKPSQDASSDVNTASWYLRAVLVKEIDRFMAGHMLLEMESEGETKGQRTIEKATRNIHHAVSLFLTVTWPIIQAFKPRLQFKLHRTDRTDRAGRTGKGKISYKPTKAIQCFLSLDHNTFSINRASSSIYGRQCTDRHITCQNLIDKVTFSISDEELETARKQLQSECEEMKLFE